MAKGRKTGGRKKGTPNRRTQERDAALEEAKEEVAQMLGDSAFAGDAHALLIAIYKDATQPVVLRMDAAKAAIGYEKPKMSAIETTFKDLTDVRDLTDAEITARLEQLERERAAPGTSGSQEGESTLN